MEINENFSYAGTSQNFDRDSYTTIAAMKAVQDKFMPNIFLATCEETGKAYIYRKTNSVDATFGKWRDATLDESAPRLTAEQISHLLYQFTALPTTSTADFPIENGTRIYNSTDKKMYVATVAQDGTITWEVEASTESGNSGSGNSDPITVANPVITITEGNVTITCATAGATVYYTTDGTAPTTDSTAYTGAFNVEDGTTVKAVAVKDETFSSTVSKKYVATSSNPSNPDPNDPNTGDPTDPNTGDPTSPDGPNTDPVVEKDYAYYGFVNGELETTESYNDEGLDLSAASIKTLNKIETSSKRAEVTFTSTQAEEDCEGQTFPVYAYPAKFGALSTFTTEGITSPIETQFTKLDLDIDGVAYNLYVQTDGFAPDHVGMNFGFIFA